MATDPRELFDKASIAILRTTQSPHAVDNFRTDSHSSMDNVTGTRVLNISQHQSDSICASGFEKCNITHVGYITESRHSNSSFSASRRMGSLNEAKPSSRALLVSRSKYRLGTLKRLSSTYNEVKLFACLKHKFSSIERCVKLTMNS